MNSRKLLPYGTGVLLSIVGIGAIVAGGGFIIDTSGEGLGMTVQLLEDSPFENFLIPGILLLLVNGIGSIVAAVLAFKNYRYAGLVTMVLGVAMLIWITAQIYWIGWESWLQPTFIVVGIVELFLGYFLHIRKSENHHFFWHHHGSHAH